MTSDNHSQIENWNSVSLKLVMTKFHQTCSRNHSADGYLAVCDNGTSNVDNTLTEETSCGMLNGKFC